MEAKQTFGLEKLMPEDAIVIINGKEYGIRKINLNDEVWLKQFGNIQKKFDVEDLDFMAKLCFRLLKDKSDFLPMEIDDYDDDGNKFKRVMTGPQRIMELMAGPSNKLELMQAMMVTFGVSRPMFNEMMTDALKKNDAAVMSLDTTTIGPKSST